MGAPPNAVEFIRMLPDNGKLFIRTSRSDGKIKEGNFRNKIARACDWDDTPNDRVRSITRVLLTEIVHLLLFGRIKG
jgi:hypothetical protein